MGKRYIKRRFSKTLELLYQRYHSVHWLDSDPLAFVHRYDDPADQEIAAFLCSALAYGRVRSIQSALEYLLEKMRPGPRAFIEGFTRRRAAFLRSFRYRFTSGEDLADLFELFRGVLCENGSLERCFLAGWNQDEVNVLPGLNTFCEGLLKNFQTDKNRPAGRGLKYLLAGPAAGGTCKRLCLFLRWVVREDALDLGIWKGVRTDQLLMPVDVHIARLTRMLGFHQRKTVNIKAVLEITEVFRKICPADPVKYDFALSRVGIVEGCTGKHSQACLTCPLDGLCFVSRQKIH